MNAPADDSQASSIGSRAVRGGLWVAAGSYWTIGLGFLVTILLTRLLDPEVFGVFALATFFAQLLRVQSKLGIGQAFAHHASRDGLAVGTFVSLESLLSLAGPIVLLALVPALQYFGYEPVVVQVALILAFGAMLEGIMSAATVLLESDLRFRPTAIVQNITFTVSYIPCVWLAFNGGGVWSLAAQNLTYNSLFLAGNWLILRRTMPELWQVPWRFDWNLAKSYLRFGSVVGIGMLAAVALTQLDNFFVGTFAGLAVLGFYDRAYRTAQWPGTLLSAVVNRAGFYTYAKLKNDPVKLGEASSIVFWLIAVVSLPLSLFVIVSAEELVTVLYGERWLPSALLLQVLIIAAIFRPIWENGASLFLATGRPKISSSITVVQAVSLAVFGLPLTLLWGATGTVVAVGVAFMVGAVLSYRGLITELSVNIWKDLRGPALAIIPVLVAYFAFTVLVSNASLNPALSLGLKLVSVFATYYAMLLLVARHETIQRTVRIWRLLRGSIQ